MSKVKIAASYFYQPSDKLKAYIEEAGDLLINNAVSPELKALANADAWTKEHFTFDEDFKDNILDRNWTYCETTTPYLVWKNQDKLLDKDTEYVGMQQYRRRFDLKQVQKMLEDSSIDIICSTPASIGTVGQQYGIEGQYFAAHNKEDFALLKYLIREQFWHQKSKDVTSRWLRSPLLVAPYNCFIMKRHLFNDYCERIYRVLNDIYQKRVQDICSRDNYQRRAIGFLAERFTSWYIYTMALGEGKVVGQVNMLFDPDEKPKTAVDNRQQ